MESSQSRPDPRHFTGTLSRPRPLYRQWMLAGNPAYFFERLVKDFGDFVHYRGLISFYQVNHPALVKQVLMDTHKTFDKRNIIYKRFGNAFGDGLVVSEGEKWKRQRKLLQEMFGPKTVQRFFEGMKRATLDFIEQWKIRYANRAVFDIAGEMDKLTLRIAGEAFFSEGFERDSHRIAAWNETINHYTAKPPLPVIRAFWFPSSLNRRLKKTLREFHQFIGGLIKERRADGPKNDMLSLLLEARHEESGEALTDHEIQEEVLGMILAGHETSSSALTWTWYELNRNPDVMAKLVAELDDVLGDGEITLEALPELKYTRMVIDESLRLHPPFWFENRNAMTDVELGGHTIPAGSIVLFTRYTLHRHRDFWRDPDKFIPERQDPDKPENARSVYAQVPFGGGPRFCIGINFAVMELIVIIATIARRLKVELSDQDRHSMAARMTMFPRHGVKVTIEARR